MVELKWEINVIKETTSKFPTCKADWRSYAAEKLGFLRLLVLWSPIRI